jgi:hypothetical protein
VSPPAAAIRATGRADQRRHARATTTKAESATRGGETAGEGRLQEAAGTVADQAARTAETAASTGMTVAGDTLDQVAEAIRQAGSQIREQQPQIAGFAETAADRVHEASSYLREHDAREVMDNVQRWAREQPAMVIGGGLALGLLVGRFLRAGSDGNGNGSGFYGSSGYRGYGAGYRGSAGYGAGYGAGYDAGSYVGQGASAAYGGGYGSAGSRGTSSIGTTDDLDQLSTDILGDDGSDTAAIDTTAVDEGVTETTTGRSSRRKR